MQINWICLNGTYKNRKLDERLATYDIYFGSNDNKYIPQVIEGDNLKDIYVYVQRENFPNIIKAAFCEGKSLNMKDLPIIEILAHKGYAYFWKLGDLLWFVKLGNKLILDPYNIIDLMQEVERNNHSSKVTHLCSRIGEVLGISINYSWEDVLYHDLGKIAIPQSLLSAPRYFTEPERHFIRTHTLHGSNLIEQLNLDEKKKIFALYHHEKYDGSGYYKGLEGGEIPLPVRILTICDVYEALSSHRPYRSALDVEIVNSFLQSKSGVWFDPELVDVFLDFIISKSVLKEK